jgi:hypothetical protein
MTATAIKNKDAFLGRGNTGTSFYDEYLRPRLSLELPNRRDHQPKT